MNKNLHYTLLAIGALSLAGLVPASAEPATVDSTVDLLRQAEAAADPGPLLAKAKDEFKHFNPKPNQAAMTIRGEGPKKKAALNMAAGKHKDEAMAAIDKAIAAAAAAPATPAAGATPALGTAMDNPGGALKGKIENAISMVHQAGELKH